MEANNGRKKPHSFHKKTKKSHNNGPSGNVNFNDNSNSDSNKKYSVTATTSKAKAPIPPNQSKKVNNKRAAKKKREKEKLLLAVRDSNNNLHGIDNDRKNNTDTPLSSTSESSTTRALLDEMNLANEDDEEEDTESEGDYEELPCDALILNTETVDKIIEQIETDIESETGEHDGEENSSDSDEFDEEEALNANIQRYFLENSGPKCFNCGESGHVLKDCPATSTVPCNLCGQLGHSRSNCPQEVCYNCSRPGHQSKACPARRKRRVYDDDLCNRCGQPGHLSRECSMAWRGYVFARDLPRSHSNFLDELRILRKRCYNCASISHFGDDCPNRRRPNYSVFHIPDYDYLDRVILRIKVSKSSTGGRVGAEGREQKHNSHGSHNEHSSHNRHSSHNSHVSHNSHNNQQQPKELNAKQKQADNFKKIVQQNQNQSKKNSSSRKIVNPAINTEDVEMYDDSRNVHQYHHHHHTSNSNHFNNDSNRKVFLQSRGIQSDNEDDRTQTPHNKHGKGGKQHQPAISFVSYEGNQVRVRNFEGDDNEDNFKKGSSKKHNGPRYRGGYK